MKRLGAEAPDWMILSLGVEEGHVNDETSMEKESLWTGEVGCTLSFFM